MNGRYNVSYGDLNELACPVLRHRIKLNFEAITDRVSADDVIREIIRELKHGSEAPAVKEVPAAEESDDQKKRGLFAGKKK